ncbi:MAG: hypothetical protein AUH94_02100 [Ktedonobacter sp. 13_2_20CM_2_54_8]|nr:MAG: hypothetical protein AUH94_02100 [Ktedonobacter sp. 13_2_20CM_2_54_8]
MPLPVTPTPVTIRTDPTSEGDTRLSGGFLVFARVGWVLLVALTLGPVVVGFPFAVVQLQQLPGGSDAVWSIALSGVSAFVWVAIGVLLFWRKSDNWMALLVALMLVVQGADSLSGVVSVSTEAGQVAAHVLDFLAFLLLFLVFCLFPNGRFVPHWIGWLVFGFLPVLLLSTFPILPFQQLWMLVWYGFLGGGVLAQLYRYRWGSSPMQRQQTKWVVLGVGVVFSVEFGLFLAFLLVPSLGPTGSLPPWLLEALSNTVPALIPLSFGLAILRYRLWDIDVLINRVLVYGLLTALLTLVYFSSVTLLQFLLRGLIGQALQDQWAVVGSTLAIAALFQPVRRRIQRSIDRRFYRRKYDAARTFAAFSSTLRHEVDLDQLGEELVAVVQETMQPSHISLWLRPTDQSRAHRAAWIGHAPAP